MAKTTVLSIFGRNKAILAKTHSFGRFCQNNAILAILPFSAALSKIKPFLPQKTLLSRFCRNRASLANYTVSNSVFQIKAVSQNHCLKKLLPKKGHFRQNHCFGEMWFGENVPRMTWKERFVQFSWKAHCFPFFERIWGQCDDFDNFEAQKCDLAETCCAWPKKSVLYNFHGKRTVFPFWREFEASVTNLRSLTLKNAISPKRAAHDLKRGFCTVFIISALSCLFGEIFRPVWRFLTLTLTNAIWQTKWIKRANRSK